MERINLDTIYKELRTVPGRYSKYLMSASISSSFSSTPSSIIVVAVAVIWNSAFGCLYLSVSPLLFDSLLFTAICKASPDIHFALLHFFSTGMVLFPVSYTVSRTSVHSSSGTLSIRSSPLNLFLISTV